jgi:CDP-2,3-bis-(O-geranylgeranyl)-sn-glycerol synthase
MFDFTWIFDPNWIFLFLFFLPAFVANAMPVIVQNIPGIKHWNTPINVQYLGSHKTYRGFVFGVLGGTITSVILFIWAQQPQYYFNFSLYQMVGAGICMSFGALLGDSVESIIKRKLGKKPGEALPVFDGIDYILGAIICAMPFYIVEWYEALFLLILGPILSFICNVIAYFLKLKKVWY